MSVNTGGTAFPLPDRYAAEGMTLRQWYAGMALQGLCANPELAFVGQLSECAFLHADSMILREKEEQAVVQESSTTDHSEDSLEKVAELEAANMELVEALEAFLGSNPTTSLCMHEGEDSFGRVMGTWGAKAEEKARTILAKHKGAA